MQDERASEGLSPPEDDDGRGAATPQPSPNGTDTHLVAPREFAVNGERMRECRVCGATKPDTAEGLATPGEFTFTRTGGTTNLLYVTVQIGGTAGLAGPYDYTFSGENGNFIVCEFTTTLNGVVQANQPVTTSYGYDGDGDLTAMTSTNRAVTTHSVDHLGRLTRVTQPSVPLYDGTAE